MTYLALFVLGLVLGAGWAESATVRERVRRSWRLGFEVGKSAEPDDDAVRRVLDLPADRLNGITREVWWGDVRYLVPSDAVETIPEAIERVIRESR